MKQIMVVKVGTKSLLGDYDTPEAVVFQQIADDIALLSQRYDIVLVTSGAVGFGVRHMQLEARPARIDQQQALSMMGQVGLLRRWREALEPIPIGQVLITRHDLAEHETNEAFQHSVQALLAYGALPIINENDAVSGEGISFGDNDRLAAAVASEIGASKLVLLTNQPGIVRNFGMHNANRMTEATTSQVAAEIQPDISDFGTGGASSKLIAAEMVAGQDIEVWISDARIPAPISAALAGTSGTKIVQ